jgi:hypothetical protein
LQVKALTDSLAKATPLFLSQKACFEPVFAQLCCHLFRTFFVPPSYQVRQIANKTKTRPEQGQNKSPATCFAAMLALKALCCCAQIQKQGLEKPCLYFIPLKPFITEKLSIILLF